MQHIHVAGKTYQGMSFPTHKSVILVLKSARGLLGCGYFDLATAGRLDEAWAIVRGVGTFEEMLTAQVVAVSPGAEGLGVQVGMTGSMALELM